MTRRPPALSTAAIGSWPHTQLELALQHALTFDIPTLPQLPRGAPAEFMLPEALEGLPGLSYNDDGRTTIDPVAWEKEARALDERIDRALGGDAAALESFEPTGAACRAWKPFLWEVEQRKAPFAKAQLAGPLTSLWATNLADGSPAHAHAAIAAQVYRLVLARALAHAKALAATGTTPIIFLDEPGLYAFDKRRPSHVVEFKELDLVARALQQAGALVGVHCCGNTDWASVFALPVDFVSADVRLSLASMLATGGALDTYLARGGWLALGIVPTTLSDATPEDLAATTLATLEERTKQVLARAILTPACGMAMLSVVDSERIVADLRDVQRRLRA